MAESIISREAGEITEEYMASYSRYVAQSRAIPSLIDGLKPVQRRILNSADDLHLYHDKKFLKSAKLEGQVVGDYHPHGGASLSGLVQPFKIRYPILEGQGNWGCPDDPYSVAASRYTEVRLTKFAEDFYLESSDYADRDDNYDGRLKEIVQYYPPIPGVLLTGAEGIAIGLTTKIPVHEIGVVCESLKKYIENPESDEYIKVIVPDTCEGSILTSTPDEVYKLYTTGEATLSYQAKTHYERGNGKCHLVVDAFPPGFSRKRIQSPSVMGYVENGLLSLSNESSTGIRYVFTTDDKDFQILDEVKSLLTSSVSYKLHIENKGVVGLYDLRTIYGQFISARKDYIIRKYTALREKDLKEVRFISAFKTLQSDKSLMHRIIDMSEDEALKTLMSIGSSLDMITEDVARRILNTPIRQLTADNHQKMMNKLAELESEITEYGSYISNPMSKILIDIDSLSKSYAGEMNSEVEYLTGKQEDITGYIVENNKIVIGKSNEAPINSNYFFLYDEEGFVVVDGNTFRNKGNPVLLKTDNLKGIIGFDKIEDYNVVYDDVTVPLGVWSIRVRTSKVVCIETKSRKLVGLVRKTSL